MPAPIMITRDLSAIIGTSSVKVFSGGALPGGLFAGNVIPGVLFYMRLWNVSATATIWLSRSGAAAQNAAGSFPLGPGLNETWVSPQAIPLNDLWAIATAAGTPLTVEIG